MVTWESFGQDGDLSGVYAQRYDATGAAVGTTEFKANTYFTSSQGSPAIAGLSNGGFVVTWFSVNQDTSGLGIYGQRYDAAGEHHRH